MTDSTTIETLMKQLASEDTIERQNARYKLIARGREAVPFLIGALEDRKHWMRWEAAKALSQIGDSTAIDALVATLRDPEFDVRWLAAEGLIVIGPPSIPAVLQKLVDEPESLVVKEGVHHVLHDMAKGSLYELLQPVKMSLEGSGPLQPEVIAQETLKKLNEFNS